MIEIIPLWLDCDPGHDDAFAILLAAYHPNLRLLGISTVYGNAPLRKTTNNALSVLEAIGRPEIPVHPGATKPFCREVIHAPEIHGESGLDGSDLLPKPKRSALVHCNAIKDMRDALMACPPDAAWLVVTGTLTNAALLFATFPEVVHHIKGVSIMGGAIGNGFTSASLGLNFTDTKGNTHPRIGNYTPWAEFNVWCDPEASRSILSNQTLASKIALIPLDLTHQAFATKTVREMLLQSKDGTKTPTKLRRMFNELLMFFGSTYADKFKLTEGPPLHDPLAVAYLLSDIIHSENRIAFDDNGGERWDVEIVLDGEQTGRTKITPSSLGRGVIIPRALNIQRFWQALDECLTSADAAMRHP